MKDRAKSKRRILRRAITAIFFALLLTGAGFFGYNSMKAEYTVTYDTYTATRGSISNALSFSGNLSLIDSATYSASSSSIVRTLYVTAGETVRESQKLVRLTNGETITAGFDGRVNRLKVAEGDEVTAGTELVQIADFSHMTVSFRVDEYDISNVSVGQACTVTVTALEKQFDTTVATIDCISASSGNVAYYTATANVDVDDERVLPGMQATVSITQEEAQDAVILKVDAVSFDETNKAYVWMKDEAGELQQVYVATGVSNGNYIEITEGLSDHDTVYAQTKVKDSGSTNLLSSLFGGQQFNQPQGAPGGNRQGGNGGGYRNGTSSSGGSGGGGFGGSSAPGGSR